jgi:NAD(P)-dependent dehydrogenase (short-subunit alcohol dehydrogenase family)
MRVPLGNKYYLTKNGLHFKIGDFTEQPKKYFIKSGDKLVGKVALVTGGHKGIGLAIARAFLREGAKVIITGRDITKLQKTAEELNTSHIVWDISNIEDNEQKMRQVFDEYGFIDVLINNAGVTSNDNYRRKNFLEMDEAHFKYIHRINVFGHISMCNVYSKIVGDNCGKIISMISDTAFRPAYDAYTTSKWALLSYIYAMQFPGNITINAIAPGATKTDMTWRNGGADSLFFSDSANFRLGLPEEVSELAVMLAGKTGDLISGKVFLCDGGQTLK